MVPLENFKLHVSPIIFLLEGAIQDHLTLSHFEWLVLRKRPLLEKLQYPLIFASNNEFYSSLSSISSISCLGWRRGAR